MKVKVFRKVGFFRRDYEIVCCESIRYSVQDKTFTGFLDKTCTQSVAYISNATGYVVLDINKGAYE